MRAKTISRRLTMDERALTHAHPLVHKSSLAPACRARCAAAARPLVVWRRLIGGRFPWSILARVVAVGALLPGLDNVALGARQNRTFGDTTKPSVLAPASSATTTTCTAPPFLSRPNSTSSASGVLMCV